MNDKLNKIVEELKTLTLLEAAELVKEIEEVFGVDTSVSVGAVAMAMPASGGGDAGGGEEEKSSFDVTLDEVPADKKIAILKIVRNATGLGLKESKEIVDNVPKVLKEGASKAEADAMKKELEDAGGKVSIK
jgi:large subunit ribosomal protein L7/L12